MSNVKVWTIADRDNAECIEVRMASEVMSLDVFHIDRLLDWFHRVYISDIAEKVGVVCKTLQVGLKVRGIYRIESYQSHK